jgi:hypothetical protein
MKCVAREVMPGTRLAIAKAGHRDHYLSSEEIDAGQRAY